MNLFADRFQIIFTDLIHFGNITIADKLPILIKMSRRKRHNLSTKPHQVLRLAGKYNHALFIITIIKRTNPNRVPCGNKFLRPSVIKNTGKLRVQQSKHPRPILAVHGKQNLTIRIAYKAVLC